MKKQIKNMDFIIPALVKISAVEKLFVPLCICNYDSTTSILIQETLLPIAANAVVSASTAKDIAGSTSTEGAHLSPAICTDGNLATIFGTITSSIGTGASVHSII